jgi:hypothetical protein
MFDATAVGVSLCYYRVPLSAGIKEMLCRAC